MPLHTLCACAGLKVFLEKKVDVVILEVSWRLVLSSAWQVPGLLESRPAASLSAPLLPHCCSDSAG